MYLTWMNISDGWWLVDWAKSIGGEQQPTTCAAKTSCPPWRVSEPDSAGHFYPVLCFLTWPKVCGQEHTCVQATLLSSGQVVKFTEDTLRESTQPQESGIFCICWMKRIQPAAFLNLWPVRTTCAEKHPWLPWWLITVTRIHMRNFLHAPHVSEESPLVASPYHKVVFVYPLLSTLSAFWRPASGRLKKTRHSHSSPQ